jgi:hypothetical protein
VSALCTSAGQEWTEQVSAAALERLRTFLEPRLKLKVDDANSAGRQAKDK